MSEAVMRRLARPLLFLAAFIWGTSFFIMKNTLDAVPPFWLLVFRFTTGAVLLGLFCWKKWRTHFTRDYLGRALRGIPLYRLHHPDLRPDRDHPLQERLPHRHLLRAGPLSGLAGVSPAARPV